MDLFGKVKVGKTTIFQLFTDPQNRMMNEGGNLSYDMRAYYARCWIFPKRWDHSMVFLCDPKFDMRWNCLDLKFMAKMFAPTNVVMIVSDSTPEDIDAITHCIPMYNKIKPGVITFIIANMQDKPGRLSVEEIQKRTGIKDVLGLVAIAPDARSKLEPFLMEGVMRYFLQLSKRGEIMQLTGDPTKPLSDEK